MVKRKILAVAFVLTAVAVVDVHAQVPYRVIAAQFGIAPGSLGVGTFANVRGVSLAATGQMTYRATVTSGAQGASGVIQTDGVQHAFLVRFGKPAPSSGGASFLNALQHVVDDVGGIALHATLSGSGVTSQNDRGLWLGDPSGLMLLAREGSQAADLEMGVQYGSFSGVRRTSSGISGFLAGLLGTGITTSNDTAIWVKDASLAVVVRDGSPAPGLEDGVRLSLTAPSWEVNSTGHVVVRSNLVGSGVTPTDDTGIWAGRAGAMELVAREGDVVSPSEPGVRFASLGPPRLSEQNVVSFDGRLSGPGITPNLNESGIWSKTIKGLVARVREGDFIPGTGDTARWGALKLLQQSENGNLVYVAGVRPTDGSSGYGALWAEGVGGLRQIVRLGNGIPGPTTPVPTASLTDIAAAVTNESGQVAFEAVTNAFQYERAVFAEDPFGRLHRVVMCLDELLGDQGVVTTVGFPQTPISGPYLMSGAATGRDGFRNFNEMSQLALDLPTPLSSASNAVVLYRVGGSAQLSPTVPLFGPAAQNGYGFDAPLRPGESMHVVGDTGFVKLSSRGSDREIWLDFDAASSESGMAAALAELRAGATIFGYSLELLHETSGFDVSLRFAERLDEIFYWNIGNIPNVDVTRVALVPEPTTLTLATCIFFSCAMRRRRLRV